MNLTAAALKVMAEKGLTLLDVAEIVAANEKDHTNADRQRRYRERKRNGVTVTRDGFPNDIDILTPSDPPSVVSNETTPPAENEPSLKPEHVVEVWNENAPAWGLKPIRKLTAGRRRKLLTRIRENSIDEFTEAISAIGRSSFLRGENGRGWRADFDWMLEPRNFTKLTEGNYDR